MNKDILVKSINVWAGNIITGLLPNIGNTSTLNKINTFIGSLFGFDLSHYSIINEFAFLIPDLLSGYINTYVNNFLNTLNIEDKDIPEKFNEIITSCINRCKDKGFINVFGLQFEAKSFEDLQNIFKSYLNNSNVGVS